MTTDKTSASEHAIQQVSDAVRAYFARGYYAASNPWRGSRQDYMEYRKRILIPDITIRKIVRRVARENKALWVDVGEGERTAYVHNDTGIEHRITFTRNRRSQVLAAPLLPIAVEFSWIMPKFPPVTITRFESLWRFRFHDADGDKIFRRWCERLQTDPTFIKALGFTPTGNPLLVPTEVQDDAQRLAT